MDLAAWKTAWGIFITNPVPLGAVALALMAAAWWFRGFLHKEHLAVKDERLAKANDEAKNFGEKLVQAEAKIARLIAVDVPPQKVSATASSTASIFQDLKTANSALQITLSPASGRFEVMGSPAILTTAKSDK